MELRFAWKKSKFINLLVFLTNMGLPIFMVLPIILNSNTTPFIVLMRFFILGISILLFVFPYNASIKQGKAPLAFWAFIFFWMVYLTRVVFDLFIFPITIHSQNIDTTKILSFAFFMCFLPVVAIYRNREFIDYSYISEKFIYWLFFESVVVILLLIFHFKTQFFGVFGNRSLITHGETTFPLNPIAISRIGASLSLAAVYMYSVLKSFGGLKFLVFLSIGIVLMLIGGSRGPLISLLIVLSILSLKWMWNFKYYLVILSIIISLYLISLQFDLFELDIVYRFWNLSNNEGFDRVGHWNSAINQFLNHPILGDKIFDDYLGSYPHNLLFEILMSVGLIGFGLFMLFFVPVIVRIINELLVPSSRLGLLSLMCILHFIFSLSSSSIYYSVELWGLMGLILFAPKIIESKNN
jgi:O-antigen ligase